MLSNPKLWQEFATESLEYLASQRQRCMLSTCHAFAADQASAKPNEFAQMPFVDSSLSLFADIVLLLDASSFDGVGESRRAILQFLQSVVVGAEFYGFGALLQWGVLLQSLLNKEDIDAVTPDAESWPILRLGFSKVSQQLEAIQKNALAETVWLGDDEVSEVKKILGQDFSFERLFEQRLPAARRQCLETGMTLYDLRVYADEDLIERGRDSLEFLQQLEGECQILSIWVDFTQFPLLEDCLKARLPIRFKIASSIALPELAKRLTLAMDAFTIEL